MFLYDGRTFTDSHEKVTFLRFPYRRPRENGMKHLKQQF